MTTANRIDVHHHILPSHYVDVVGPTPIGAQGSSGRVPAWSIAQALDGMERSGIATAITSVSAPGFAPLEAGATRALARWCNEFAATMVTDYPGRFGMFAALPLPGADAAIAEAVYAFDDLHADGVCLLSNYQGRYLGDARFRPLYEELDRRHAVVFVHPTSPVNPVSIEALSLSTLEFTFDTTRAVASLVFSGTLAAFPSIRWILSHAGGTIPWLAGRIDVLSGNNPAVRAMIPDGFTALMSKMYFDCALSANAPQMNLLARLAGRDRLLFGSDYPFGPKAQMESTAAAIEALRWGRDAKRALEHENAWRLFPQFRLKSEPSRSP